MKEVKKPWGSFRQFVFNEKCTVKILILNPKQELSLQKHKKRKELWYFFDKAIVQLNKKRFKVRKGSIIHVNRNTAHRIIAEKKVEVLEISFGKFEEKDEIRLEDKYDRKNYSS